MVILRSECKIYALYHKVTTFLEMQKLESYNYYKLLFINKMNF